MQKLIVQVAAKASLKHCVPLSLPLPVSVKRGGVFHLAKGDSVNEAGELLWVMKEAYIVFSLLLALQAPVLLFPLLFNSSARVACRQELTPETPPRKWLPFCSCATPSGTMPCTPGQDFQDSRSSPAVCLSWSLSSQSHTGMRICPLCWSPNRELWSGTWTLGCHSPFTCNR